MEMLVRVLALCVALFLKESLATNNTNSTRKYNDFFFHSTHNGSKLTWMMMPDDNGLVVSALLKGLSPAQERANNHVQFLFWNREHRNNPEKVIFNGDASVFTRFNPSLKTIILIHGFTDLIKQPFFFKTLVDAFLKQDNYNIIGVNWAKLASIPWYGDAVDNTVSVGRTTARVIKSLRTRDSFYTPLKIHVVAHNLGTLVAGVAASHLNERKIDKITGLDPPYIFTDTLSLDRKLDKEDAKVVEIVHTSGDYVGINSHVGHRDFYPNGGKWPQPGCLFDIADRCSVRRAILYYSEAVKDRKSFRATKCDSYSDYLDGLCANNPTTTLFNEEPETLRGKFYFKTNTHQPFSIDSTEDDYQD